MTSNTTAIFSSTYTYSPCANCSILAMSDGDCCDDCPFGKWGYFSKPEEDAKLHTFQTIEGDTFVGNGRSVPSPAYEVVPLERLQFAVVYTHIDGSLSSVGYYWRDGELVADGSLNDNRIPNDEEQIPTMMEIFDTYRSMAMWAGRH